MPSPTKAVWRTRILDARHLRSAETRAVENAALATFATTLAHRGSVVCAYVPVGSEPGALSMLDALADVGAEVLVPITRPESPLSWGRYLGSEMLVAAGFGLHEPNGEVLPPDAVGRATTVLVPALAVDRRGVRLGRGAGFYDRTLHLVHPSAAIVAVVLDDELVDELPEDPHDVRMGWALTPGRGLVQLGDDQGAE